MTAVVGGAYKKNIRSSLLGKEERMWYTLGVLRCSRYSYYIIVPLMITCSCVVACLDRHCPQVLDEPYE